MARDIARKANCMLVTLAGVDPFVKTKLFQSFCLPLYGSVTWTLLCRGLKTLEVMPMFEEDLEAACQLPHWYSTLYHWADEHC